MGISIFGYLALQLFLGGVMPIPTWRGAVVSYLVLTGVIVMVCLLMYSWPPLEEWTSTWLPALLGPAIMIGGYSAVARLGQWRIERQIGSHGSL
jgi:peptidoglycan/LPS O-acetylase OafA/YrhL